MLFTASIAPPDIIIFGLQEVIDIKSRKLMAYNVLLGASGKKKTDDGPFCSATVCLHLHPSTSSISRWWDFLHNNMSNNRSIPPALISVSRIRTLVASIFVSLGSGTNYIRKFYGMEQLVDCLSLCSLFATTGNTAEDVLYAVEHCRASWKWCGISGNLAPLPDTFQSGFTAGNFFSLLFGRNLIRTRVHDNALNVC